MPELTLTTPRLRIRNLLPTDLPDFLAYRSNPDVTKYQGFDVMNHEQAQTFIAEQQHKHFGQPGEWVQYGIEHAATGRLLGDCALKLDQYDSRIAEIGITISPLSQRNGYAKEAMLGILSFLFDTYRVHRVVEIVDAENAASIQLLKSIGFRQEGHFIENIFFKGKWGSEMQFALLAREWAALRA